MSKGFALGLDEVEDELAGLLGEGLVNDVGVVNVEVVADLVD